MARRLGDPGALIVAINARGSQSFRHDGQAERRRLGAEVLALPGKPVTAEAFAHVALTGICSSAADFDAADRHADQAARIADRYHLPVIAAMVSIHRARRAAVDGNMATAEQLFMTGVRGLLAIAIDDLERAESAYRDLLPYAARPVGTDTMIATLWPAAQILGDLASHLGLPGAEAHYRHALAIAEQAHVELWRQAATRRLR